jgi:hypothetical protein
VWSYQLLGARGSVVAWGTTLQAGRSRVPFPMRSFIWFFNWPIPSSRTMALVSTQPLKKLVPEIFLGVKSGRRVELTTLPPSMNLMSENVGASTSRNPKGLHVLYSDNLTLPVDYCSKICCNILWKSKRLLLSVNSARGYKSMALCNVSVTSCLFFYGAEL